MVNLREVLKKFSHSIKNGEPIILSSATMEPATPNSTERVDQAAVRDVLRRRDEGLRQIFSGVSDDFTTPDQSE